MNRKGNSVLFWILLVVFGLYTALSISLSVFRLTHIERTASYRVLLLLLWLLIAAAAVAAAAFLSFRREIPAAKPTDALPDYSNPEVYADSTVTFYPEPRDYSEPPRQAPQNDLPHENDANIAFILGIFSLLGGLLSFLPGLLAIRWAQACRTEPKNGPWMPTCRRRAQSAFVFGFAGLVETISFLFFW